MQPNYTTYLQQQNSLYKGNVMAAWIIFKYNVYLAEGGGGGGWGRMSGV